MTESGTVGARGGAATGNPRSRRQAAALVLSLVACTVAVDIDAEQCVDESDCVARGFPEMVCVDSVCVQDSALACRGVPWPEPSSEHFPFSQTILDLVTGAPVAGLSVRACQALDVECGAPAAEALTDDFGEYTVSLPSGFRGHLTARALGDAPAIAPVNIHLFPPPVHDASWTGGAAIVTALDTISTLLARAGISRVEGTGHVFFVVADCEENPLPGVVVTTSVVTPETVVTYVGDSGQPDLALSQTGAVGQGAVFNVPAGYQTIRAVHETQGLLFEQAVLVDADATASLAILPSPAT